MIEILKDGSKSLGRYIRLSLVTALGVVIASNPANAGTIVCSVEVGATAVTPNGTVVPYMSGIGWPYMCSLTTDYSTSAGVISPETCKGWLSMFITANAAKKHIVLYFDYGAAAAPADCGSISNFSWQIPLVFPYFMTLED